VEFDEDWARDGAKPPAEEEAPRGGAAAEAQPAAAADNGDGDGDSAQPAPEAQPVTSE
jgi:hypothetical protein